MKSIKDFFETCDLSQITKCVISAPRKKSAEYKKIDVVRTENGLHMTRYTQKQAFHDSIDESTLREFVMTNTSNYKQINIWDSQFEYIFLISKSGEINYKKKSCEINHSVVAQDKRKKYIIDAGKVIEPLVDMGVMTREGQIIASKYDKYRQINRFIELIDDAIKKYDKKSINIVDFGCGKSYLTFILYHYLKEIAGLDVHIVGLDLKRDVIEACNETAKRYGYDGLSFIACDIRDFEPDFDVDMVVSLHACDVGTDFALHNAIRWNTRMIFSIPCCQHELNSQLEAGNLKILQRYGLIKERFSSLATDAIRANLLEYC